MARQVKSLVEAYGTRKSLALLESWKDNITAVRKVDPSFSDEAALKLARVLENTREEISRAEQIFEATQPVDVGPFKKYAFDLITAVMPNLIAEELVSVQPLEQKLGQIFYLKYLFGSDKGSVRKGDVMFGPHQVAPQGYNATNYSSEYVDNEVLDALGSTEYSGNLAYVPVRPGTVVIDCGGGVVATDDGQGSLTGTGVTSGTINYETGAYTLSLAAEAAADPTAEYQYNLEYAPSTIPQVNLKVEERVITARPRKLRALYAFDSAYDLRKSQGIDIDDSLLEAISAEIKHEIDGEIMQDLYAQAGLSSTWDIHNATNYVSQREHRETFISELSAASNAIFQATRRAVGNFIIVGKLGADVLESLGEPRFKFSAPGALAGPHYAGTLDNKWKVYKNPYYNEDEYLVGYKGQLFLDAGYVYAPYLPIFATQLLMLDDFVGRRGFATSYGKRMLNNQLYVKGQITNSGA